MAFIDIHTNNLTRQIRSTNTYLDNWVYVPGTAIAGDWKKPYALRSVDDYQRMFGTYSPDGSITYEYVCGLLSSGLPVLFRRIAYKNQNNITDVDIIKAERAMSKDEADLTEEEKDDLAKVVGVKRAKVVFRHEEVDPATGLNRSIDDIIVSEKYGGTMGNNMSMVFKSGGNSSYIIEVYYKNALLESKKFVTIPTSVTDKLEEKQIIIDALQKLTMEKVDVQVVNKDPVSFTLPSKEEVRFMGGADIDEGLVGNEIKASLEFIYDKILYQPKFITSGGYTDENIDGEHSTPIADAMKDITLARQDCRALIDLPIGTPVDKYPTLAALVSYNQGGDTVTIPSASMCGPWQYMQVGKSQLWLPPSFAYLTVIGNAVSSGGKAYTPKAGLMSGVVTNIIKPEFEIGSTIAEKWQSDIETNINPIMRLQNGAYVISGNSTLLQPDPTGMEINAFQESSTDLTIIEIRRFIFNLASELQYQYNATAAFETFSLRSAKFFEVMRSEGSISDYVIANISTNDDPRKLKLRVDVYVTPTIKKIEIFLNVAYGSVEISTGGVE